MHFSAGELAKLFNGTVVGNPEVTVYKLAKIEEADDRSISFYANPKYEDFIYTTKAAILLVPESFKPKQEVQPSLIQVQDPYTCMSQLLEMFTKDQTQGKSGIHSLSFVHPSAELQEGVYVAPFAYIGENVKLGKDCKIFPHAFIGDDASVGDDSIIYSGVHVYHKCVIGKNCIVHSGTIIGSDGFGFAPQEDGSFKKITQSGNVILEDDVEVGGNTVIDRATMGSTVIQRGSKIDNLVQIAHNVEIGKHTVIASQAGISGSTKLGDHCMVGGQAGFVGHIKIADGVKVNAQSGVSKSEETKGARLTGSPARGFIEHYRKEALIKQIPELVKRIEELETALKSKSE